MKEIIVKKISGGMPEVESVSKLMDAELVGFVPINVVNWADYPYCPDVKFRIAHTGDAILLNYRVSEASVRAVANGDQGRVWEDACCEFFVRAEDEGEYYNFECNCVGTLLLNYGVKGNRQGATQDILSTVKRWSSLGRDNFEERVGECSWELSLVIPASAMFKHNIKDFSGMTMRANFYKCGDLLQTPHFLSWCPIDLPKPCFHSPDFFGKIVFEK